MNCKYCHKPAGFLKSSHKECAEKYINAQKEIVSLIHEKLNQNSLYSDLESDIKRISKSGYLTDVECESLLVEGIREWASSGVKEYTTLMTLIQSLPCDLQEKVKGLPEIRVAWETFIPGSLSNELQKQEINPEAISIIKNDAYLVGIQDSALNRVIGDEFKRRIEEILADGIIDDDEEESLSRFINETGFDPNSDEALADTYHKFVQALILKDFSKEGESHRLELTQSAILLGKNEYPIWAYKGVEAYMDKIGKQYVGGNNGVSVKICKGVYYRTGATKGHSVDYNYVESQGHGSLVITNKAIYFVGAKSIKILINKIVTLEPYSDGLKIQKEGVRNNSFTFVGFDSWFMMNLLPLLNN